MRNKNKHKTKALIFQFLYYNTHMGNVAGKKKPEQKQQAVKTAHLAQRLEVSVLTPVYTAHTEERFLREAYNALREQEGVDWEWVVQVDGDALRLPEWLLEDPLPVHLDD